MMGQVDRIYLPWSDKQIKGAKISIKELYELSFLYEKSLITRSGISIPNHLQSGFAMLVNQSHKPTEH